MPSAADSIGGWGQSCKPGIYAHHACWQRQWIMLSSHPLGTQEDVCACAVSMPLLFPIQSWSMGPRATATRAFGSMSWICRARSAHLPNEIVKPLSSRGGVLGPLAGGCSRLPLLLLTPPQQGRGGAGRNTLPLSRPLRPVCPGGLWASGALHAGCPGRARGASSIGSPQGAHGGRGSIHQGAPPCIGAICEGGPG